MRISVIGCGYLGAVHAAAMAKLGHDVIGIDVDARRISELQAGRAPFFEPGLPELLSEAQQTGRLAFSTDMAEARAPSCTSSVWAPPSARARTPQTCATSTPPSHRWLNT